MKIDLDRTRSDYTADEIKEAIEERLALHVQLAGELEGVLAFECEPQDDDVMALRVAKSQLTEARSAFSSAEDDLRAARGEVARLEGVVAEMQPELLAEIGRLQSRLGEVDSEIREFLLRQSFQERKAPARFEFGGVVVTRTRTNKTVVTYDADAVLQRFPQLADYVLDGDPLVRPTLNAGIADRMLNDATIAPDVKDALRAARTESFAKSPSVGIAKAVDKEASDDNA